MADFFWLGSGDIGSSFNWFPQPDPLHPTIPGPGDNAHFIGGGGTLSGVLDVAGAYFQGGSFTLSAVSITAQLEFDDEFSVILDSGNLVVDGSPAGNEEIGSTRTGRFDQNGGSNSVLSGLLLGFGASGMGTYNLNAGDLLSNAQTYGSRIFRPPPAASPLGAVTRASCGRGLNRSAGDRNNASHPPWPRRFPVVGLFLRHEIKEGPPAMGLGARRRGQPLGAKGGSRRLPEAYHVAPPPGA